MKDTKEHIMRTAAALFIQKSYAEVSMRELVEKSGMSKGAFYHYFSGKEELFKEIIEFFFISFLTWDYDVLAHDSLYNFYNEYLAFGEKEIKARTEEWGDLITPGEPNLYNLMFDAVNIIPEFKSRLDVLGKRELKGWIDIINFARNKGEIESVMSDEQIARVFIRTSDGVALHFVTFGNPDGLWTELKSIWDGFYQSLKKKE